MIYQRHRFQQSVVLMKWAQMSDEGWMTTFEREREREYETKQKGARDECMSERVGVQVGVEGGQSGYRPRTLCLSENQISHPDSITTVFLRRGNTLSSAVSRLVSLQNLSLAR